MVFIGKKIYSKFLNMIKKKDIIIFRVNKKKVAIKSNEIYYNIIDVRDIKIKLIKIYFNNFFLKKSIRSHLFNYLYQIDYNFHMKSCLIKYLLDNKFKIDDIYAPFLSKEDLALFSKFNLKIKKTTSFKIKFKPNLSMVSMINLLKHRKIQLNKLIKHFSEEKSRYNPKIKYSTVLRAKNENSEKIYINKLNKSLNNTIIYIAPYLSAFTFRQEEYIEYLKTNKRDYFFYIPKTNFYYALKKAINIFLYLLPYGLKIPLFQIAIQRIEIDDIVKNIRKNFSYIQEFYANINSNPGTFYLTEKLKESKIKVIFFSNGLGVNCPFVNYDVFYIFSKFQRSYYFGTSTFKHFKSKLSKKRKENITNEKLALFFVGQTLLSDPSLKLASTYKKVISFIEKISSDLKIPTYAKYHPGSTEKDKILSDKINIVDKIEDLPSNYKYLAVTLYSTYVVELLNLMPFIIINPQEKINMKYYFPNNDSIYAKIYQEFKDKVNKLMKDTNYYFEYWNKIISHY